jgi:hypothetical protein
MVRCLLIEGKSHGGDVSGTEQLASCDVLLLHFDRAKPGPEALQRFQDYFKAPGNALVPRKPAMAKIM